MAWKNKLFIFMGFGMLVAAVVLGISAREFVRHAAIAEGVVDRLNAGGSHPQIEFNTASGQKISYPQGGWIFGYHPGDRVRVLYSVDDPLNTAHINSVGALYCPAIFFCILGLCFTVVGLLTKG